MSDVTINVLVNSTQAEAEIKAIQAKADAVVKDWATKRSILMSQVRQAFTYVQSLMSSARMALSLFGDQLSPFYDALFGIVTSTVSMLLAIATAFASGVVTSPFAAVVAGIAIGLNILTTAKLVADKAIIMAGTQEIKDALAVGTGFMRGMTGGMF